MTLFDSLAAVAIAAVFATAANAAEVTWKFAHENQETVPAAKAAHRLADEVKQKTGGRFEIQVFPAGQLGKEQQLVEQAQLGTVQMTFTPTAPLTNFAPTVQLLDLPFIFPSAQAAYAVLDGAVGDEILESLDKRGLKGLAFWESGFKQMTSSVRPIHGPDDLRGVKVRTMQSPLLIAQYKAWGANPVPISFSETYNALQQGVADAQENPLVSIDSMKFYEVQKFLTITNHGYIGFIVMANKAAFDKLPAEFRTALLDATRDARDWERAESKRVNDELLAKMKSKLQVTDLSPAGRQQFIDQSKKLHSEIANPETRKLLDRVYAITAKYQ
ncbi:MAG: TRAP transporter substrate-binding protein [Betaproteobacteria bacterium]